jgi:hypothetical protein
MSTISDVIDGARRILQDTLAPYRNEDADLLNAFNMAMHETYRIRPDLFLSVGYTYTTYTSSDLDENFPLSEFMIPQFQSYIAGFIELADDEFATDGRAIALMNKFTTGLLSTM